MTVANTAPNVPGSRLRASGVTPECSPHRSGGQPRRHPQGRKQGLEILRSLAQSRSREEAARDVTPLCLITNLAAPGHTSAFLAGVRGINTQRHQRPFVLRGGGRVSYRLPKGYKVQKVIK